MRAAVAASPVESEPTSPATAEPASWHYDHLRSLRWPLQPLIDATNLKPDQLRRRVGRSEESFARDRAEGLSDAMADRWAIRLGLHPAQVWPEWFDAGLSLFDRCFLESGWRPAWLWTEGQTRELPAPTVEAAPAPASGSADESESRRRARSIQLLDAVAGVDTPDVLQVAAL